MYIDSPDFSRRKVLNGKGKGNQQKGSYEYIFGLQRAMLANHVSNRLNEHKQDELILQKFRKQAEQLKKRKYQSKKASPVKIVQQIPVTSIRQQKAKQKQYIYEYPQQQQQVIKQKQKQVIDSSYVITKQSNDLARQYDKSIVNHYQSLLKSKNKQLRKKQKKLDKSKLVIKNMQYKIKQMDSWKKIKYQQQQYELQRINSIIQQINNKLEQNRSIFKQQIDKLKYDLHHTKVQQKSMIVNAFQSIPILEKHKKIKQYDSQRFLSGPSVYYEVENNSKINNMQQSLTKLTKSRSKVKDHMKWIQETLKD